MKETQDKIIGKAIKAMEIGGLVATTLTGCATQETTEVVNSDYNDYSDSYLITGTLKGMEAKKIVPRTRIKASLNKWPEKMDDLTISEVAEESNDVAIIPIEEEPIINKAKDSYINVSQYDESFFDTINISNYYGPSIVDALIAIGCPWDIGFRTQIAECYCIENYTGTEAQNIELMRILKLDPKDRPRRNHTDIGESPVLTDPIVEEENYKIGATSISYEPIDQKTHKKITRVCNQLGQEEIYEEIFNCEFEHPIYNTALNAYQMICKDCKQIINVRVEEQNDNHNKNKEKHKHKHNFTKKEVVKIIPTKDGTHIVVYDLICPVDSYRERHAESVKCNLKIQYIDGKEVPVCKDCGYAYKELAKDHTKHNLVGDIKYEVVGYYKDDKHEVKGYKKCSICGEMVEVELTDDQKYVACSYGDIQTDENGNKYQECSKCHHHKDVKDEHIEHNYVGNIQYEYEDLGNGQHKITSKKQYCSICEAYVDLELTEEEKEAQDCTYGAIQTDDNGNKYQECSKCGHHKDIQEKCDHQVIDWTEETVWDKDTETHNRIRKGYCIHCGEEVIEILQENVACSKSWAYNVDGRDIESCSGCGHVYQDKEHSHSGSVKEAPADNWCQKFEGKCETCGETYIDESSKKDHDFELEGPISVYDEETDTSYKKYKYVCGNCGKTDIRDDKTDTQQKEPEKEEIIDTEIEDSEKIELEETITENYISEVYDEEDESIYTEESEEYSEIDNTDDIQDSNNEGQEKKEQSDGKQQGDVQEEKESSITVTSTAEVASMAYISMDSNARADLSYLLNDNSDDIYLAGSAYLDDEKGMTLELLKK